MKRLLCVVLMFCLFGCANVESKNSDSVDDLIGTNTISVTLIHLGAPKWNYDEVKDDSYDAGLTCYCPCKCEDYYKGLQDWSQFIDKCEAYQK